MFDVTFMTSDWTCIFGNGCQGVLTGPAPELEQGCCSYGAHFTGKQDARTVERLRPSSHRVSGSSTNRANGGWSTGSPDGDLGTRLVKDACIFLNRPGFPGRGGMRLALGGIGPGSQPRGPEARSLLAAPTATGGRDRRRDGHVTSVIRQWDRRHWGGGGEEFHWWCTEAPEAFVGREPVYVHGAELTNGREEGLRALRRPRPGARDPAEPGCGAPPPGRAEPDRFGRCHGRGRRLNLWGRRGSGALGLLGPELVLERIVVGVRGRRDRPEDAVVLVLFGEAP